MASAVLLGANPYNDVVSPASPCSLGVGSFAGTDFIIPGDTILGIGLIDAPVPYCSADTLPAAVASIESVTIKVQASGGNGNHSGSNIVALTVTGPGPSTVEGTAQNIGVWFGFAGPTQFSQTFLLNPITGLPWTRAQLVGYGYGFRWKTAGGGMNTCNVWGMWAEVEYTAIVPKTGDITLTAAAGLAIDGRVGVPRGGAAALTLDSTPAFATHLGRGLVLDVPSATGTSSWQLQRAGLRPSKQETK